MGKGGSTGGRGGGGGKGGKGFAGWPSKTGNPSGGGRANAPQVAAQVVRAQVARTPAAVRAPAAEVAAGADLVAVERDARAG